MRTHMGTHMYMCKVREWVASKDKVQPASSPEKKSSTSKRGGSRLAGLMRDLTASGRKGSLQSSLSSPSGASGSSASQLRKMSMSVDASQGEKAEKPSGASRQRRNSKSYMNEPGEPRFISNLAS